MINNNLVYKLTSPSNKFYIGSTNNLERRFREHCEGQNAHSGYIHSAAKKYGADKIKIEILAECQTREEAYLIEQEYLNKHFNDCLCMNSKNKAKGFSSEQAKTARANVKNVFDLNEHMKLHPEKRSGKKGKTYSHISSIQRGAKYIAVYNKQKELIGKFEDIKSLKETFPQFISAGNISMCAKGKLTHYKQHTFIYTDDPESFKMSKIEEDLIDIKNKINDKLNQKPKEMTTRQLIEYKKDNRPFAYAIKEPSGEIIYLKNWSLNQYCKDKKIGISDLYTQGYSNNYFFTKDLTKAGIKKLKAAEYKIRTGNSKTFELYIDGIFSETIFNLTQWCKDNDYPLNTIRYISYGKNPNNKYKFEFRKV